MFILEDWAGNRLHGNIEFETFEDGWDFIAEHYQEEDFEDLYILPKDGK
jgi:hypothetical protein